jgi:hypothetical protein
MGTAPIPADRNIAHALQTLILAENELLQIIRTGGHSKALAIYEAHAFVRQAIQALSSETDAKPEKG